VVVVSHDSTLTRHYPRPDGQWLQARGRRSGISLDELLRYDVAGSSPGSAYEKRFEAKAVDGTRMPRLATYSRSRARRQRPRALQHRDKISPLHPGRTVSPESFARAFIAVIRREKMEKRVTIQYRLAHARRRRRRPGESTRSISRAAELHG